MVRQELQFESNGKEKFALLILTLITRHTIMHCYHLFCNVNWLRADFISFKDMTC